jgi:hypothetical protein
MPTATESGGTSDVQHFTRNLTRFSQIANSLGDVAGG